MDKLLKSENVSLFPPPYYYVVSTSRYYLLNGVPKKCRLVNLTYFLVFVVIFRHRELEGRLFYNHDHLLNVNTPYIKFQPSSP